MNLIFVLLNYVEGPRRLSASPDSDNGSFAGISRSEGLISKLFGSC